MLRHAAIVVRFVMRSSRSARILVDMQATATIKNASLDGNTRRAIDIYETDKINEKALQALIRAAVALNTSRQRKGA